MSVDFKVDYANEMIGQAIGDLRALGLPVNHDWSVFFCSECGGVVMICTGEPGLKEGECRDCGLTQCLQTCYRQQFLGIPVVQVASTCDAPQLSAEGNK